MAVLAKLEDFFINRFTIANGNTIPRKYRKSATLLKKNGNAKGLSSSSFLTDW
ncbi:MAG: hypothetical protein QM737_21335 [Ferruginibacter sp.]